MDTHRCRCLPSDECHESGVRTGKPPGSTPQPARGSNRDGLRHREVGHADIGNRWSAFILRIFGRLFRPRGTIFRCVIPADFWRCGHGFPQSFHRLGDFLIHALEIRPEGIHIGGFGARAFHSPLNPFRNLIDLFTGNFSSGGFFGSRNGCRRRLCFGADSRGEITCRRNSLYALFRPASRCVLRRSS